MRVILKPYVLTSVEESILMDSVPSETRARWKSLDSIAGVGWAGSAFLGGIIAVRTYIHQPVLSARALFTCAAKTKNMKY